METKKDSGIVNIHGKAYETVALRVRKFRDKHPDFSLLTEIVSRDEEVVVMRASISDTTGRVIATGHSEEMRAASQINRTSALENAETSAIGRALAAFGLGGTEFATADEVANAIGQQKSKVTPNAGAGDNLTEKQKSMVRDTATLIIDALSEERDTDALGLCESFTDDQLEEKLFLWTLLNSTQRRRIKEASARAKQKAA